MPKYLYLSLYLQAQMRAAESGRRQPREREDSRTAGGGVAEARDLKCRLVGLAVRMRMTCSPVYEYLAVAILPVWPP